LFLLKEKERLSPDSPFSHHIHHFWEVFFLLSFFIFTHSTSLYFCCPSCLFNQWPSAQWQQPDWLAMPAARLVCFLYNTTISTKHLKLLGLHHLNIYHLKRHRNSVTWNFLKNIAKIITAIILLLFEVSSWSSIICSGLIVEENYTDIHTWWTDQSPAQNNNYSYSGKCLKLLISSPG
jgi:hypothetical protein